MLSVLGQNDLWSDLKMDRKYKNHLGLKTSLSERQLLDLITLNSHLKSNINKSLEQFSLSNISEAAAYCAVVNCWAETA